MRLELNSSIEGLGDVIDSMKESFDSLGIDINLKRNVLYGPELDFNVTSARDYLIELDQYMSKLLIFKSTKMPGADPELASLDLQIMPPKNFEPDEITIGDVLDKDVILNSEDHILPLSTLEF